MRNVYVIRATYFIQSQSIGRRRSIRGILYARARVYLIFSSILLFIINFSATLILYFVSIKTRYDYYINKFANIIFTYMDSRIYHYLLVLPNFPLALKQNFANHFCESRPSSRDTRSFIFLIGVAHEPIRPRISTLRIMRRRLYRGHAD